MIRTPAFMPVGTAATVKAMHPNAVASPASALVAGVAALIRLRYPRLSPEQVEQAMIYSASDRPAGGYSPGTGFGEVARARRAHRGGAAGRRPSRYRTRGRPVRFGPAPGPIQVVDRDTARIDGYGAASAVLLLVGGSCWSGSLSGSGGPGRAGAR